MERYNEFPEVESLLRGCFLENPKERPRAQMLFQRFLDKYNEECAAIEKLHGDVLKLLEAGHERIYKQRQYEHKTIESTTLPLPFSEQEVETLLRFEKSRDGQESKLRLAPQINFVVGAGIFWDMIKVEYVHVDPTIVSRGTPSPKGSYSNGRADVVSV
jgi:hypothetical protein